MKKHIILNFMMLMAVFSIGLRQPLQASSSLQRVTLQDRFYNSDIKDGPTGENADWGQATPEEVVEPWM